MKGKWSGYETAVTPDIQTWLKALFRVIWNFGLGMSEIPMPPASDQRLDGYGEPAMFSLRVGERSLSPSSTSMTTIPERSPVVIPMFHR
jgi:hypothetical protein